MTKRLRIVVTGLIAQHPTLGGVSWDYVQYAAGLKRLGHDVYYLEDSGEWPYLLQADGEGSWVAKDPSINIRHLRNTLARFGLSYQWMYRFPTTDTWYGLNSTQRREVLSTADMLINVSGTLERPEEYRDIPIRVYIDSDPVFTQLKLLDSSANSSFLRRAEGHNIFFSFGERLMETGLQGTWNWLPTRQPILLNEWEHRLPARNTFTTVMSWTSYPPISYKGLSYGQKDVQLRQIINLPSAVSNGTLEIALGGSNHIGWETDPSKDVTPEELLKQYGWNVIPASSVSSSLDTYRSYIIRSKAEFSVAKHGYVAGQTGWFSCRSACYLAAGRPVVVEDTGFSDILPVGKGVLTFKNHQEAEEAISLINSDYETHARAARNIAAKYFNSDHVLNNLILAALKHYSL